jgi:two-component system, OmpR family, alkaline phosphatase synthesis response regulator PhoP
MTRILIADDDSEDLFYAAHALKLHGFSVYLAQTGEEAIGKARRLDPDLLVLDIVMPRASGIEVANELRQDPAFQQKPIVFLTSLRNDRKVHLNDTDAILAKPVEIVELVEVAQTLLNRASKGPLLIPIPR